MPIKDKELRKSDKAGGQDTDPSGSQIIALGTLLHPSHYY